MAGLGVFCPLPFVFMEEGGEVVLYFFFFFFLSPKGSIHTPNEYLVLKL